MSLIRKWRNFAKFNFDSARYQSPVGGTTFTRALFRTLHGHDPNDKLTVFVDRTVAGLILISVTLDLFLDIQNSRQLLLPLVKSLDWLSTIALTLEFLLKLFTAGLDPRLTGLTIKHIRFLARPLSLVDLIVIIPSWLSMFFPWHLLVVQFLRILRLAELVHPAMSTITVFIRETKGYTARRRIFSAFFGGERDHGIPGLVDFIIFAMILLSILLMTLESVDWMRELYKPKFHTLEVIVTGVFITEYLFRLYCCVEDPKFRRPILGRIRFVFTGSSLIDLAAISPFFLTLVWIGPVPWLWALRLLRMFKLARYSPAVSTIISVVREERAVLSAAIMMLFLLTVFAASGIYVAEHDAQPDKFSSIPVAMYWAVITLTSIGYGDYYPITPVGKILTMILAIAGLGMIALPAGILANGFSQKIKTNHKLRHKDAVDQFGFAEHQNYRSTPNKTEVPDKASTQHHMTMDQVLRSAESKEKLQKIIHDLNRAEREALIAITALSLTGNNDP